MNEKPKVAYFEVSFVNSYIGWDVMAYDEKGFIVDRVDNWDLPAYYYHKKSAVARAKDLAASVGVTDIRVGLRKNGGWYPEGLKA